MRRTKIISLFLVSSLLFILTSCHGKLSLPEDSSNAGAEAVSGTSSFSVPESFDESKEYNITFWAKNDNNKTQQVISYCLFSSKLSGTEKVSISLEPWQDTRKPRQSVAKTSNMTSLVVIFIP